MQSSELYSSTPNPNQLLPPTFKDPAQETASSRQPYRRRIVAGVLAGGLLLGSTGCSVAGTAVERFTGGTSATEAGVSEDDLIEPTVEAVPEDIRQDFAKAVAVDSCETKVTADEAAAAYQRLFLVNEQPNLSFEGLRQRTEVVTEAIAVSRERQGTIGLPENFEQLEQDAYKDRQIPLDAYKQAADAYFAKFGVETVFDWKAPASMQEYADKLDRDGVDKLYYYADPMTESSLGSNQVARTQIVATMRGFSTVPPNLISQKPLKYLAFGDLKDPDHGGQYFGQDDMIIVDTGSSNQQLTSQEAASNAFHARTIGLHEVAHKADKDLCGIIMMTRDEDPAIQKLNDGFIPSESNKAAANALQVMNGKYTTLNSDLVGTRVVSAKAYGASNGVEGKAVDLGEIGMHGNGIGNLLKDPRDTRVMKQKLAYQFARAEKQYPGVLEYYGTMFDAARVQVAVQAPAEILFNQWFDRLSQNQSTYPPVEIEDDPELQRLDAERHKYRQLEDQLASALGGTVI